ncbi:ABC transporter ATP-binding protein [Mameliella sediminis]|uniref:ABC transporter ATP-binding protein n=1 Tax=Mameliella sediminis TaxID=2836866 RepID=UPI001C451B7A|nr:ABC transporter ATP-binding protein [Mameliella sediminis]MBY6116728.1 ABC transporter ATP-binding protein [Antarctobacter heliothermus]MBY6146481.1 ABC transporter ATP-binding protein [Mameliella alba]MBV7396383.1 ABC transporter ATP-binding protein [Mameliella sediminis]MBY6162709.1 ABC transporter ATP-binding protein [Mameliella alba]MBY6170972.1 ABC transporter ATP-binding protein [Mameliella alba]
MALEFRNVSKIFPTNSGVDLTAVKDVSFRVEEGEFVSAVGPSGCGKSTILSMTAGLYQPSIGEVLVSDVPVTGPNAHVGFMLQKDLLLPWRNIISNIEFGLEARGVAKDLRRARAMQELKHCHLEGFDQQYPYQLSGGMRQRAALARTLAIDPEIILLDEPFSALDAQTKLLLQNSFAKTIAEARKTTLLITHDLSEAVLMSDRILVLSERPGTVIADIKVDLPHRDEPIKRRTLPEVGDYAAQLFKLLKLEEKAA